jgi:DNA/RNA-binding domain of Phe-tRNA-synthetase-like protein
MIRLFFESELREKCPEFCVGLVCADVRNSPSSLALWSHIEEACAQVFQDLTIPKIVWDPAIAATRAAYKACGKDPNRYRPSAEALRRRLVQGKGLYQVNTLVDVVNLLSLETGASIGGFDASQVTGDLTWGIGREGEHYDAIGRGVLNIGKLPVLRDEVGPIGTPTSDHERTKIVLDTTRILLNINSFRGPAGLNAAIERAVQLLELHANLTSAETGILSPNGHSPVIVDRTR